MRGSSSIACGMGANAPRVSGRHRMAETGTGSVSGRRTRVARGPKGDAEFAAPVRPSAGQGAFSSIKRRAVLPSQPKADFDSGDALRARMHQSGPGCPVFLPFLPSLGFRSSPVICSVWPKGQA